MRSASHYLAALARAGEFQQGLALIQSAPSDWKPFLLHEWIQGLLDAGHLEEAARAAQQLAPLPQYSPQDSVVQQVDWLLKRLIERLWQAQRYEDALRTAELYKRYTNEDQDRHLLSYYAQRAAEEGRLDLAVQAAQQLGKYHTVAELYMLRAWLQQGRIQEARRWLQRMPARSSEGFSLRRPLYPAHQQTLDTVRRYVRQGRRADAVRTAETALRGYLESHNQKTIDMAQLTLLSMQFSVLLSPDTMERIILRLPTQRYECAENHLLAGYQYGLGATGQWRKLLRELERSHTLEYAPALRWLLMAEALEQNQQAFARRIGKRVTEPIGELEDAFSVVQVLLESGRTETARKLVNFIETPTLHESFEQQLRKLRARSVEPEIIEAIQQIHKISPFQIYLYGSFEVSDLSLFTSAVLSGEYRIYPAVLSIAQQRPAYWEEPELRYFIPRNAWRQGFYDSRLAEWFLRTPCEDFGDRQRVAYVAASAARQGRFDEAERLLQHAGWVERDLIEVYRAGYAVGLARQGRYREAVRAARRLSIGELRVYALSHIAAEMRRRGR
ncbi:MAG: hypothetical protein P3X24_007310 [bacterium]|nr:hypothetical protein [bacterium]